MLCCFHPNQPDWVGKASGMCGCFPSSNCGPQASAFWLLYRPYCHYDQLHCVFQFWLLQIPLGTRVEAACSGMVEGGGQALWLSFLPGNGGCYDTASCCPSILSLCPDHWAPTHGTCLSLRQECLGIQRVKKHCVILPFPSSCGQLWAAFCSTCFPFSSQLLWFAHLQMLGCADSSDVLVCRLGIICWTVGVQLVISRREIRGDLSHHHAFDSTSNICNP